MDSQSYSRLMSYVFCELTMPVKRHVYNFLIDNQGTMNHHLLVAASKAVKRQNQCDFEIQKRRIKTEGIDTANVSPSSPNQQLSNIHAVKGNDTLNETSDKNYQDSLNSELIFEEREDSSSGEKSEELREIFDTTEITRCNTNSSQITSAIGQEVQRIENEDEWLDGFFGENTNDSETSNPESCDEMAGFASDPLLLCSDADFKTMFRMTRSTFRNLVVFLSKEEMEPIADVALYKKVLIVLWLMGNSGSYSDAGQVFGVTEEVAANCFFDVCATLYNKSDSVIVWPSLDESAEIASRIEKDFGFPGVVGVLGCNYFTISIPKEALSRREHFNAKYRRYCIAMQIVCDDRLIIRDIFPGLPGGLPQAQILKDSPLCEQLTSTNNPQLVDKHKHILARSEYPQLQFMLTPYKADVISKDESEINKLHERVCQLLDQTFKMLQDRFLTLKMLDPEVATMVLVSACVLHNICMENGDTF